MRKILCLTGILLILLSACGANKSTTTSIEVSAEKTVAVQTVIAGANQTATADAPTDMPVPSSTTNSVLTLNGQLKGVLVFIRYYNLWMSFNGVETQLTTDAISAQLGSAQLWYSNPRISQDGTKVAYLKNTSNVSTYSYTRALMISDIDGKNTRQLIDDVAWTLPAVEWSNDNQRIYYLVSTGNDVTTGFETMTVKSVNLTTGDVLEHGQFFRKTGCGGGSDDMADIVSGNEGIGYLGKGQIFALSPQNNYVMHSTSCSNGLGVLDFSTQQDIILDDNHVYLAAISSDGFRIAAASESNIMIFNLTNGTIEQTFPTSEPPRAISWNNNNTAIFYSTSKSIGTQTLDESIGLEVFKNPNITITLNLSTLWKLSLTNGENSKIIDMDAYDLRPIFATDQTVLVAKIENTNVLFDYLIQGNRDDLVQHYPSANLIEVDLAFSTSNVIINKTIQADYLSAR